jgi:hypothetical protein
VLRFLVDENFDNDIVRGVRRRTPDADMVRVQDVGLLGADDPTVLEWASQDKRIVLTHDVATITKYAYERIHAGISMPEVVEISKAVPIGVAIEELIFFVEASDQSEWEGRVVYLPLR